MSLRNTHYFGQLDGHLPVSRGLTVSLCIWFTATTGPTNSGLSPDWRRGGGKGFDQINKNQIKLFHCDKCYYDIFYKLPNSLYRLISHIEALDTKRNDPKLSIHFMCVLRNLQVACHQKAQTPPLICNSWWQACNMKNKHFIGSIYIYIILYCSKFWLNHLHTCISAFW